MKRFHLILIMFLIGNIYIGKCDIAVLDSIISEEQRVDHSYNEAGQLVSEILMHRWFGEMEKLRKNTYTYDSDGNRLTYLWEKWEDDQWIGVRRYTYTYDSEGNRLTYLSETWKDDQWIASYRFTYTYNSEGNRLTELREDWEDDQWVANFRITYTAYDSEGNKLTYSREQWKDDQWIESYRHTFTYDTDGNMLTELREDWIADQWMAYRRYSYTYDSDGNKLTYLSENSKGIATRRFTYTYDSEGNRLTELRENWKDDQWIGYDRYSFTYNSVGHMLTFSAENWQDGDWVSESDCLNLENHFDFGYNLNPCGLQVNLYWRDVSNSYNNIDYTLSYKAYPIPSDEFVNLEYILNNSQNVKIVLYDLLGNEIETLKDEFQHSGEHKVIYRPKNGHRGIFYYTIQFNQNKQSGKFIILK